MEHQELVTLMSKKTHISKQKSDLILKIFAEEVKSGVMQGKRVNLLGFGELKSVLKEQKVVFVPKTNKKMLTPPKMVVKLTPSASLKDTITKLNSK